MKTCTKCKTQKSPADFSWTDRAHRWRDSQCRACRAAAQKRRRKPKHSVKPAKFPRGLNATVCDHITELQLAYLAGLIDGEGCITSSYPRSTRSPLTLTVAMIHRPTIEWLRMTVGGGVVQRRTHQAPVRQSWSWQIKGVRTYALLKRLLPYMHTKRDEAEVACAFGETFFANLVRGKVTEEVQALRRELGQQLRDLKKREWKGD